MAQESATSVPNRWCTVCAACIISSGTLSPAAQFLGLTRPSLIWRTELDLENRAKTRKIHVLSPVLSLVGRMSPPLQHCLLAKLCRALVSFYRKHFDN